MVQYEHKILNQLLETYENSLLSKGENKRTIQIEFRFTKSSIPAYFDESSSEYENIHILMNMLENKGFIQIQWKDHKKNFQIQKVRLNLEKIEEIYRYVGRTPKRSSEDETIILLQKYQKYDACVTKFFASYLLERLERHQSVKEYIDITKHQETEAFLQACVYVEQNKKPCYIREFSIEHFRDSKYFEQIEGRLTKVFRRFSQDYADMNTSEILAEYGIYKTPNYVYFKGEASIAIGETKVDLSVLTHGIGLAGDDLLHVQFSDLSKVKKVITVENLTSFFSIKEDESLIIYLGGYHNEVRRALLKIIYRYLPKALYLHFGDIDAGGFSILLDLRKKTGIPFSSYHMDLDTLKKYSQFGKKITESDRTRLNKLLENEEFEDVIRYMLKNDIKLEQEVVGTHHPPRG